MLGRDIIPEEEIEFARSLVTALSTIHNKSFTEEEAIKEFYKSKSFLEKKQITDDKETENFWKKVNDSTRSLHGK